MSSPPPPGYRSVSAYLMVADPGAVAAFARAVFGAAEVEQPTCDKAGRVSHVALAIGDSVIMAGRASDEFPAQPAMLHVYVADADATWAAALAAGADACLALSDQPYGDRMGGVRDGQGVVWWIATRRAPAP
jgi:PhnB protein